MDGYVSKPVSADELFKAIAALVPDSRQGETDALARQHVGSDHRNQENEVIGLAQLMERLEGDQEFLQQIIDLFLQASPSLISDIGNAISNNDSSALAEAAHKLKGSVASLQANAALEAALELENIGRSGEMNGAAEALAKLEREIDRVEDVIKEYATEYAQK